MWKCGGVEGVVGRLGGWGVTSGSCETSGTQTGTQHSMEDWRLEDWEIEGWVAEKGEIWYSIAICLNRRMANA